MGKSSSINNEQRLSSTGVLLSKMETSLNISWNNISKKTFINDYWQKRPVVLKNALPAFDELTDENELAGLAMEEFVDSRIVEQKPDDSWHVEHGPFNDYSKWQQGKWTLLVQGVDQYLPNVASLLSIVEFLPAWRIEDIMVSFSMPGAGVGLHLDQYDVFIVQGKGKRRWQAGKVDREQCQEETSLDLLQLRDPQSFEPLVDEILEPGDIIYIPPFSAHKGETTQAAINYSIGFRAPSQQELLSDLADYAIDNELGLKRFTGAVEYSENNEVEFLPKQDLDGLRHLLLELVQDKDTFEKFCHERYLNK